MRLVTYGERGQQRLGVVIADDVADATALFPNMLALIEGGAEALDRLKAALDDLPRAPLASVNLLAPIPRPAKNILCLGLNYQAHVAEGAVAQGIDRPAPACPMWFTKAVTSVCGPYDDIAIDTDISLQFDWEVELMVVIGKAGRKISAENALEHVYGYTVFNDFSVRDIQRRVGSPAQWFKGKSYDKASPMGPSLITADEFGLPPIVDVECRVNGVVKQQANTRDMIFSIATAIADISEVMTLEPGDLIATGTPAGVGFARTPPEFLKVGDLLETTVEGIGTLRNRIVAERS